MISMGGGGRWESAKATLARTVFLGVEGRTAVGEDVVSSILWHRWTFIHNKQAQIRAFSMIREAGILAHIFSILAT